MKSLIFLDKKEAKECYCTMKEKGMKVQEPEKQAMPKGSRKVYDLNGKPIKSRWILKVSTGKGYGGAETLEEAEFEAFKAEVESSATPEEKEEAVRDIIAAKSPYAKAKAPKKSAEDMVREQWKEREAVKSASKQKTGKGLRIPRTQRGRRHMEAEAEPFEKTHESWKEAEAYATKQRRAGMKAYVTHKKGVWKTHTGTKKALSSPETLKQARQAERKLAKKRKERFEKPLKEIKKSTRVPMHTTARHAAKTLLHKPSSFIPLEGKHYAIGGGASMVPGRFPRIAQLPEAKDITDQFRRPF